MNDEASVESSGWSRVRRFAWFSTAKLGAILWLASGLAVWGGDQTNTDLPGGMAEPGVSDSNTVANALGMLPTEPTPAGDPSATAALGSPTNDSTEPAPEPGHMPLKGVISKTAVNPAAQRKYFQEQMELARKMRGEKNTAEATKALAGLLETNAPLELKRSALFEMALVAQDDNQLPRAQQIFAQYLRLYPEDPTVPEVLLREGLVYRQMGVTSLAISKFYAVMSTALNLKLSNMDYYRKLVLQAQVEIADTYYLEGKYTEASDYFSRLLKTETPDLDKAQIQFKLIRSLSFQTNNAETVAKAQIFLEINPDSADVPEVRFVLASALKRLERNQESMKQVLLLLQSQQENVKKNPEAWLYWQRRAGNEIANQLYKEGDYLNALEIYLSLSELDKSPAWQLPVWYQTGLIYEQLQQWNKATEIYARMINRQKEVTEADSSPTLVSLFDMAKWRKDYIGWMEKAKETNTAFEHGASAATAASTPPAAAK